MLCMKRLPRLHLCCFTVIARQLFPTLAFYSNPGPTIGAELERREQHKGKDDQASDKEKNKKKKQQQNKAGAKSSKGSRPSSQGPQMPRPRHKAEPVLSDVFTRCNLESSGGRGRSETPCGGGVSAREKGALDVEKGDKQHTDSRLSSA